MVKWQDSIRAMCQKPTPELHEIRGNLYNLLQARGLPADLLADVFYWKGVIDSELQLRAVGERRQSSAGGWVDFSTRSPGAPESPVEKESGTT